MKRKNCGGCKKSTCDGCQLFLEKKLKTDKDGLQKTVLRIKGEELNALGIAYDVGTTTIAASLWDLKTGECIGTLSCLNLQRSWGNDVVSRISYCMENETEHVKELQAIVIEAMDRLAAKLIKDHKASGRICRATVVGNTAMCELVMGVSVAGLAKAPFHKGYVGFSSFKGAELGFKALKKTEIVVLPAIEGYVGADALAVYTYAKSVGAGENSLLIDIGTNGEMILIGKDKVYACSAAAGPALEGAAVECGMLALTGAISGVRMAGRFPTEDIFCEVIGETLPAGICGSGLLDIMALLYRQGVVDKNGYLKSRQEAAKEGVGAKLCQRLETVDGENRFFLAEGKKAIYLTGQDIRQLQLAKSAIRAGMEILMQKANLSVEEIDHIYLAGAFGNDIRPESAVAIGLLPEIESDKIKTLGNGAGFGAAMALLSTKVTEEMSRMSEEIIHIELAEEESFEALFVRHMDLP